MKTYQITFNVPDDFVPEEMELNVSYKDDIEIIGEGEVDISDELLSKTSLLPTKIEKGQVVIYKFPEDMPPDISSLILKQLEANLPDNTIIGMVDNVDLLVQNSDDAVKMLEGMINKVSTRAKILMK